MGDIDAGRALWKAGLDRAGLTKDLHDAGGQIVAEGAKQEAAATAAATRTVSKIGQMTRQGVVAVTAGASALFAQATRGALQMQDAAARFRAETGATEEQANAAAAAMNRLAGQNLQSFDVVSRTLTSVHTNLGLVGKDAEAVTGKILKFSTATGTDAVQNVGKFDDILDSWGKTAADLPGIMDQLIASTQQYGGSIGEVQDAVVAMAPQVRAMGGDLTDAIGIVDLFRASGLDAGAAQRALNTAIGNIPAGETLDDVLRRISAIPDPTERAKEAMKTFGAKAGAGLANALQPGFQSLADFQVSVGDAAGATEDAANAIEGTLPNKIQLAVNHGLEIVRGFGQDFGPAMTGGLAAFNFAASIGTALGLDNVLKGIWGKVAGSAAVQGAAGLAGAAAGVAYQGAQDVAQAGIAVLGKLIPASLKSIWSNVATDGEVLKAASVAGGAAGAAFAAGAALAIPALLSGPLEDWTSKTFHMPSSDDLVAQAQKNRAAADAARRKYFAPPMEKPPAEVYGTADADVLWQEEQRRLADSQRAWEQAQMAEARAAADMQEKARQTAQTLTSAAVDHMDAARRMAAAAAYAREKVIGQFRSMDGGVQAELKSMTDDADQQMANLRWAISHPNAWKHTRDALEEQMAQAQKALARAEKQGRPEVIGQAQATIAAIQAELDKLPPHAKKKGDATSDTLKDHLPSSAEGTSWGNAFTSSYNAAIAAGAKGTDTAAAGIAKALWNNLKVSSPAKMGPLSEAGGPGAWGEKAGSLFGGGVDRSLAVWGGPKLQRWFGDGMGSMDSFAGVVRHEHSGTVRIEVDGKNLPAGVTNEGLGQAIGAAIAAGSPDLRFTSPRRY